MRLENSPCAPAGTARIALPYSAHLVWGGIGRRCWMRNSAVTCNQYLIQHKETGNFQSHSHYLQCEKDIKEGSKFRSPKQSSLNFTANHSTEKFTQTATCPLPSPFSICVRISRVTSFPSWMSSLLWSRHSFPTRRSSLTLSFTSFISFCFHGMYWIQNFFSHFIPFASKKLTVLFFKQAPSFLLNDICHKNIYSPWSKVNLPKVKGLVWSEKYFNLHMLMCSLVRADVLGTISKISHLSMERNCSMQYRISPLGPKRKTRALKAWTTAFMRNRGMIFNLNISYYIHNFIAHEFGPKIYFFYGKNVHIFSTLSESCHPSWTKGKNVNFCSGGCESIKPSKKTHAGGKRRKKHRKEALNVNFASVLKH